MKSSASKPIPLAHSLISAGAGAELDEGYSLLDLNMWLTGNRDGFLAVVITGDSMRPNIEPGYLVVVDTYREPKNGDTVVVSVNNETCVKVFQQEQQRLYLVPKNGDYPVREVKPSDNFRILGVATAHFAIY